MARVRYTNMQYLAVLRTASTVLDATTVKGTGLAETAETGLVSGLN